jgi:hypothetical protein
LMPCAAYLQESSTHALQLRKLVPKQTPKDVTTHVAGYLRWLETFFAWGLGFPEQSGGSAPGAGGCAPGASSRLSDPGPGNRNLQISTGFS